ncbi:pentapeptide repeat-containing protein [Glaciimonas immobilis]|uniref:Pentapeptide repeat-containing protein n=1 Tax=Glaciimonas immobilis TaxID=728004 RepID=A0A840RUH2_9BURK|nr:pentapeptide repeat-containing protein [Glaciimonas immobilis]KAF3997510.1 pentapeptide repeat-containing protein [Glaciimonas immobilis]MBB5200812.1 hypothetical protein [Glaciimonas immobilis]
MKIEIKHRWNGTVLFSHECEENTMKITLAMAINAQANLSGSNLRDSDLRGSNLSGSNLTPIRDDIWAVLSGAPSEVPSLILALKSGSVDGSAYTGICSCLVGTLDDARDPTLPLRAPISRNYNRPAERFFMGINEGDTPETNQFSKLALEWSEQWLTAMHAAFCPELLPIKPLT